MLSEGRDTSNDPPLRTPACTATCMLTILGEVSRCASWNNTFLGNRMFCVGKHCGLRAERYNEWETSKSCSFSFQRLLGYAAQATESMCDHKGRQEFQAPASLATCRRWRCVIDRTWSDALLTVVQRKILRKQGTILRKRR